MQKEPIMRPLVLFTLLILAFSCSKRTHITGSLAGSKWLWMHTTEGSLKTEPKKKDVFTITFNSEAGVSITTDCNNGGGSYTIDQSKLKISNIISTRMYCEGAQETVFFDWLQKVNSYQIKDDQLVLDFGTGSLTFKKM